MNWEPEWMVFEETRLARHVTPAAEWLVPPFAANPSDLPDTPAGRREKIALIYYALLSVGIYYDTETYTVGLGETGQLIRTPFEILESPRIATCLDLALLLAGVALANDLIAVVVVNQRHAYVLVSVQSDLREASNPGRAGMHRFRRQHQTCRGSSPRSCPDSGHSTAAGTEGWNDRPGQRVRGRALRTRCLPPRSDPAHRRGTDNTDVTMDVTAIDLTPIQVELSEVLQDRVPEEYR